MNIAKILGLVVVAAVALALIGLVVKLLTGVLGLVSGLLNAVLGVAVVIALIAIVAWMFRYAAKNGKK